MGFRVFVILAIFKLYNYIDYTEQIHPKLQLKK